MADPRYFRVAGPFSVSELARQTGAEIAGAANTELILDDVQSLETAQPNHLSFLSNLRYAEIFRQSKAGAVFIVAAAKDKAPAGMTLLVVADPYLAFAQAAWLFYPHHERRSDIAATAVIEAEVTLGTNVSIGHHAVIGSGTHIGDGTRIGAHAVIGSNVIIGADCDLHASVTLSHCVVGERVTIYPGVRIGQDGFGFATDSAGKHLLIPQLGRVLIGDDVCIGANTTIDRGAGPDTVIGPGCMIDNLVQIGHNVVMGRGCVLASQTGVSGSTKLGDFVMIGGQVGLAGHINIGSASKIAGKSGVMKDVAPRAVMGGIPAVPMVQWLRHNAILERLARRRDR